MPDNDRSTSCYSARMVVEYARKHGLDIDSFLIHLDTLYHNLMDPNAWMSVFDWLKLIRYTETNVMKNAEAIGYEVVYANKLSTFRLWLIQALPLTMVKNLNLLDKIITRYINHNMHMHIVELGSCSMVLIVEVADKSLYAKEICSYNKGALKAVMELKGYKEVDIHEDCCANYIGDTCIYRITWTGKDRAYSIASAKKAYRAMLLNGDAGSSDVAKSVPVSEHDIDQLFKEDTNGK